MPVEAVDRNARSKSSLATLIALVALVLALGGGSYVGLAKETKKTGAKFYAAHRFLPKDSSETGFAGTGLGSRICTSTSNQPGEETFFGTELELPDGIQITAVTFYYYDNNADAGFSFHLGGALIGPEGGDHDGILTQNDEIAPPATSSGVDADPRTAEIMVSPPYEVDNGMEDLGLTVGFGECEPPPMDVTHLVLHGARVEYNLK